MRWIKVPRQLKSGMIRRRSGFLFFPKTIGNETRWFEYAVWEEVYQSIPATIGPTEWWSASKWINY